MINVVKSDGAIEPFNKEKVLDSMRRAGVPKEIESLALKHIHTKLYNNIKTSEIYYHIAEFLDKSEKPYCRAKYRLKHAIMEFGPTGYPFEDFVAKLLQKDECQTTVRQILDGKCIKHEVDIVAEKNGIKSMIECKFHNRMEGHTETHVSLYTKARFDDLKDIHKFNDCWLVTNTRITTDALGYALCSNLKVISWSYPPSGGLRDLIEKLKLHPITTLTTLSQNQKQQLLQKHVVVCRELLKNTSILNTLAISKEKIQSILEEAQFVCVT